jgi:SOS-response transcriptional repressor LexA
MRCARIFWFFWNWRCIVLDDKTLRAFAKALIRRSDRDFDALSDATGVSRSTIEGIIYNGNLPQGENAKQIVAALGKDIPPEEAARLIEETEKMPREEEMRKRALEIVLKSELSSAELSFKTRTSETTVRSWLKEHRLPRIDAAKRVLEAFGAEVEPPPADPREMPDAAALAPVVGTVGASARGVIGSVQVDGDHWPTAVKDGTIFRLEVCDESMVPLAWPGQWVVVNCALRVRSGDLAVVDLATGEDAPELVFKRIRIDAAGGWVLESVNASTKPVKLAHPPRHVCAVQGTIYRQS